MESRGKWGAVKRQVACGFALLLAFATQAAYAFFDPPWITPAAAMAGDIVSVNIHGGICDAIFEQPGYPQITQQGNAVRIVEYGDHTELFDLCIYGVGTLTVPIGTFPSGDYMLTVDLLYDDALFGPTIITLGVVPFTVLGAAPVAAPTSSLTSLFALSLLLTVIAVRILRTRRRT